MPVKIQALDYRSTQANLDSQTTVITQFISNKTVTKVVVVDEYILCHYTNVVPANSTKIRVFNLVDSIRTNGIAATETAINNYFTANVTQLLQDPISLDSGVVVLVYR